MAENERFQLRRGMGVVDRDETSVGAIEGILSETDTGISRFIRVDGRLLPVETIEGVLGDKVKLAVPQGKVTEFPRQTEGQMPDPDTQRQAYGVLGLDGPAVERP